MRLPLEAELRAERARLVETLDGLTDEEFESGTTLCEGWAPRDVLAHLIAVDYPRSYTRHPGRINAANEAQVRAARGTSRRRLMDVAGRWVDRPSATTRSAAWFLLGDLSVHHQDILRGLGRERRVPRPIGAAILREGIFLSWFLNRRLLRYRVAPDDGGRPLGRGPTVGGSREALGMWLAGRDVVRDELSFDGQGHGQGQS